MSAASTLNILWFLPTHGDGRYLETAIGGRAVDLGYLRQVAQAADSLGYVGLKAFRGIVAGAASLALAGALSSAALAQNTPIKLSLDWKFEGPAAPFFVALEKGYFTEEGLDVTIDSGAGSLEPINRVASGTYQMGFGDINSLIKLKDQDPGAPVQAIYMVYDKPAFAIVGRKSQGVSAPKDLEGKKLGAPAPDGAYAQWPIFARANGIDAAKVRIENVGFPVREPMLAQGQVDAITGFSFSSFINLKAAGVPEDDISVMLMADHGVALYGTRSSSTPNSPKPIPKR